LIRIGDFFFKHRNIVFPLLLLPLFVLFKPEPVAQAVFSLGSKEILALVMVFSGLGFRMATIGWAYIKRGGLNKEVYANTLVTKGFFGLCRNPLYVGNMLIYSGLFLFHGNPIVIILGTGLYWFIYESIIAAEEYFLKEKFGPDYDAYCQAVPRWIPDFRHYKASTQDMNFTFERSLTKDYTTIYNTLFAIISIEVIKDFYRDQTLLWTTLQPWLFGLGLLTLVLAFIRAYKKQRKNAH
jgi:protein-S-isoprenylcysteine O-methyltransferase Ste14